MPLSCDRRCLQNRIASLNHVDSVAPTVDAHIRWEEGKDFTIGSGSKAGESVDKAKVQTAIRRDRLRHDRSIWKHWDVTPIQVTSGDASPALCAQMNQVAKMRPSPSIGDATETLSGTEYVSWYTGGENGVITVDRDKAAAYIKARWQRNTTQLNYPYFPYHFRKRGSLDILMDGRLTETAETDNLVLMAQTGINQEREVQFSQQAASHSGRRLGQYRHAEVDFGAQHVYKNENGAPDLGCSVRNRKTYPKTT